VFRLWQSQLVFFLLYWLFRAEISNWYVVPNVENVIALKDKWGAVFHSLLFIGTLAIMWTSSSSHITAPLWGVSAIAATIAFIYNGWTWPWKLSSDISTNIPASVYIDQPSIYNPVSEPSTPIRDSAVLTVNSDFQSPSTSPDKPRKDSTTTLPDESTKLLDSSFNGNFSLNYTNNHNSLEINKFLQLTFTELTPKPTLQATFTMLPWRMVPFILGMFVILKSLQISGWFEVMTELFYSCISISSTYSSVIGAAYFIVFISLFITNLINNQVAIYFFLQIILHSSFESLPKVLQSVTILGVTIGTSLAGNFTLIASLAGIMFANILQQKGVNLSYADYFLIGLRIMPLVYLLSAGLLCIEHVIYVR